MASSAGSTPDDLARTSRAPRLPAAIEVERRRAHPDEVGGRVGERPVDAEHRELDLLARAGRRAPSTTRFGRVAALDRQAARSGRARRQLAVDPDLGVVVDHVSNTTVDAGRIEGADLLGHGDVDAVPVEGEPARGAARLERGGSSTAQLESSKPAAPALGSMSLVLIDRPLGFMSAPAALKSTSTILASL